MKGKPFFAQLRGKEKRAGDQSEGAKSDMQIQKCVPRWLQRARVFDFHVDQAGLVDPHHEVLDNGVCADCKCKEKNNGPNDFFHDLDLSVIGDIG